MIYQQVESPEFTLNTFQFCVKKCTCDHEVLQRVGSAASDSFSCRNDVTGN